MIVQEDTTMDTTGEQEIITTGIETVSIIAEEEGTTKEIGTMVETLEGKREEDLTKETIEDPTGQVELVEVMVEVLVGWEGLGGIPQWLTQDPVSPF